MGVVPSKKITSLACIAGPKCPQDCCNISLIRHILDLIVIFVGAGCFAVDASRLQSLRQPSRQCEELFSVFK
eukprot:5826089-Amphidinium_carterae.1